LRNRSIQSFFFIFKWTSIHSIMVSSTFIASLFWSESSCSNWFWLIMIKSCCSIRVLVSFLCFHSELGSFHFVCDFHEIILVKLYHRSFTHVLLIQFLEMLVSTFELILNSSHAHANVWLLTIMFLVWNKFLFSFCMFHNFALKTTFGSMNLIDVRIIMFLQDTSRVL